MLRLMVGRADLSMLVTSCLTAGEMELPDRFEEECSKYCPTASRYWLTRSPPLKPTRHEQNSHEKSCWRVVSRLIFDKHMLVTPKHFYVAFWTTLFCVCLVQDKEGVFQSALWWPKDSKSVRDTGL